MALKSCIKKVIAARGPEPKNFIPKESVPEGAEMVTASGNYEIKHMKDGTFVVEISRLVRLVNGPIIESGNVFKTKKEAEKFAKEHWKSQDIDVDDRQYMLDLITRGRPDFEILNRLEQKIIKEKDEIDWPTPKKGSVKKSEGSNPRLDRTEDSAKPKSDRTPSDAAPLKWETGKDRVTSGNYIIHETFDASIKAKPFVLNRTSPFKPIGLYKSLAEAKKAALEHYNSNVTEPDLGDGALRENDEFAFLDVDLGHENQTKDNNALYLTKDTIDKIFTKLAEESELIARYMKTNLKSSIVLGIENLYWPQTDQVHITGVTRKNSKDTFDLKGRRLNLNDPNDFAKLKQSVEHEIIHANTVGYILKTMQEGNSADLKDILYLGKAITELGIARDNGTLDPGIISTLTTETKERIDYILEQPTMERSVSEFLAIMGAESATSQEIMKILGRRQGVSENTIKRTIERLITRIREWADSLTKKDLTEELDIEKLSGALIRTLEQGREFREQQYEAHKRYAGQIENSYNYGPKNGPKNSKIHYTNKASFDYLNYAVATMLNSRFERKGKKILGNLHDILNERFPLYTDAANKLRGLYDGSHALQQFIHTVTGENVDKVKKADILARFAAVNAQRTETTNDQIGKLTALSMKLSDSEHTDLDVFTSQMPLHDYFVANEAGDLSTAEKIEAKAELLRKELSRINSRAVREVDSLIDWNIGIWNKDTGKLEQKQTGNLYNLSTKYPPGEEYPTADFQVKLRQLLALESINRYGAKKFENLMKNQELFEVIKDNSMANVLSTLDNAGTGNVRDSLVMDYYKEPVEIKAVHKRDFRMYEYGENTGWKILEAPTNTKLGIVYKPTIDSTDIAGAYTDMKLISTDVDVRREFKNFPGVVESVNGHKLLLTKDQKREMGLIEDFSQGLVRSTAHSMALQESQIIRDELLKKETHMIIGKGNSITKLETIIKAENVDNPWFLKLEEGTEYSKLSPEIRAKYMPVEGRASDVKGFNENVDLVRKDISHWLLGGTAKSLFENPTMKWALRILKNTISGSKIGMVVLNPIKIANDNLFNIMYLGVLGVSPFFIASSYKEISKDFAQYSDLQRQIFQAKLQHVARPESDKIKKHLSNLQKRLAANSIGDIGDKGFVNSLGSDLVSRSADTLSGFQADMHKALEYLLLKKDGSKNRVSNFIVELQKIGYQAEDFFSYLGNIASRSKSTALLHQELDLVSERLREIKSEEDIVNYVAQFTTSPSSEAVRFGSAMTDLTDVLAKETLYRHLTQNKGMSPSDARIEVLDSFPDYKENMPIAIKGLSDVGIIMFPTFWLRIQKSIYHIIHHKPVSLATELMAQEVLGTNVNTIFEANVINKSQQFGGILHSPFEHSGVGSVIPTHLW